MLLLKAHLIVFVLTTIDEKFLKLVLNKKKISVLSTENCIKNSIFKFKDFNSNSLNILVNLLPNLLQNHNIKSLFVDSIVNFLNFKPLEKKNYNFGFIYKQYQLIFSYM